MSPRTNPWLILALALPLAACGAPTRQDRAVDRAEQNTEAAEKDADEADRNVDNSRASQDVLEENDPEAIAEANRILEATPEEEPLD